VEEELSITLQSTYRKWPDTGSVWPGWIGYCRHLSTTREIDNGAIRISFGNDLPGELLQSDRIVARLEGVGCGAIGNVQTRRNAAGIDFGSVIIPALGGRPVGDLIAIVPGFHVAFALERF
jgi:hypothetical protein